MKICNYCDSVLENDMTSCPHCGGNDISGICPNCGQRDKGKFCSSCGTRLDAKEKVCPDCGNHYYSNACPNCGYISKKAGAKYAGARFQSDDTRFSDAQDYNYGEAESNTTHTYTVNYTVNETSPKNWLATLLLCIFFGYVGAHQFYAGKIGMGVLYLCTGGVFYIGWIYDIYRIIVKKFPDKYGRIITDQV